MFRRINILLIVFACLIPSFSAKAESVCTDIAHKESYISSPNHDELFANVRNYDYSEIIGVNRLSQKTQDNNRPQRYKTTKEIFSIDVKRNYTASLYTLYVNPSTKFDFFSSIKISYPFCCFW